MISKVESLHPIEVRVLGALLEKDLTTPEYYPLTLNALQNACNQKSSREPIVDYDETTVAQGLDLLRQKQLVLKVSGAGHRVEKYAHRLGETLNLGRRELALLCVLMLRGPQTVGELRGRTERMHPFAELDEVEHVLQSLAAREPDPLVAPATRGRWRHLWSSAEVETADEAESRPPRPGLEARVSALEHEIDQLKRQLESFRRQFE
jgi:uncharacterized protein YceH (UPF0502 family)